MLEPARPIRLALVDDHPAIIGAITGAVARAPDIDVVGTARTFDEALTLMRPATAPPPDVVLCDVQLAGEAERLRLLERLDGGRPPILFLTSFDQPALLRAAFERGAAATS